MLVAVETSCRIVLFESVALQIGKQRWLNGNLILANDETFVGAHRLVLLIPWVLLDLLRREALVWVCLHDLV